MGIFWGLFLSFIFLVGRFQVKGGASFAKYGAGESFPAYQPAFEEKRLPVERFFPIGGPVPDGSSLYMPNVYNQYYGYPPQGLKLPQYELQHQGTPLQMGPGFPPQAPSMLQYVYDLPQGQKGPWQNHNANMQQVPPVVKYQAYPTTMQKLNVFQKPGTSKQQFGYPSKQPTNPRQKFLGKKHADLIKRPQKPALMFRKSSPSQKRHYGAN